MQSAFRVSILLLLFLSSWTSFSQVDENDTITKGSDLGKIKLGNPPSIVDAYKYDPVTDKYIFSSTFDGFNINYPIILTPKEYEQLVLRESIKKYFKEKSDAIEGKKEGTEEAKRNLLPRYYVNSGFFETIFGASILELYHHLKERMLFRVL